MMKDSKLSRRKSGKNLNFEEAENVPVNVNIRDSSIRRMSIDSCSRPPLNTIHNPSKQPAQESGFKSSKTHTTPTKAKIRHQESAMAMRTPEKQGLSGRDRFGWGHDSAVNTPRSCRTLGRASLGVSELNSTYNTPTKSVAKPPNPGLIYGGSSRPPVRTGNFAALYKGIPVTSNTCTTVNTVEVPHFDLSEDPSFWMDHNVQVLIRIRPLNGMEISSQGYNRCLKQESAQCLTWVGNPETRFTFDHVACETIDQETLFKMVGQPMVENCLSGYNSCMFAYGQTGSGKTHTMLGEINNLEVKPSPYRGMTPRIFEFLFSRIIAEEGSRKNERLKYNCKCSFLEIYNEQITDLLDPSSTNLQLREDVKKGVYVENLTEFEVHTVGDILRLLSQGSANRRVASTNMNRESSRSHSVFTCVIESRWEKDSTSNLRFARLNLVDLAGSERQKSSGAEGERLKEAANINKSLSTLGHVIMVLVDGANARTRHVPYRDSRLTFLLQDSLGGNSKTMIIANVSPSVSSATETLNTLKFAQRAKLIQNNAVINEDASGDVEALQYQIRLLKEELATLKRLNISRSLTYNSKNENCSNASSIDTYEDDEKVLRVSCKQLKSLETSLNGALRREQTTENSIKQLEAEIEQLNSLVRQREEENRCTKMMLKFREDKIQRMECLLAGKLTVDSYLLEENNMVNEEINVLRAKVDRNPEVTRFAVENIRLLEQLRRFQDFYEEGEREMLLTEVSELRDQLALLLNENSKQDDCMNQSIEKEGTEDKKEDDFLQLELKKSQEELEKCRDNLNSCLDKNAKLCREISDLNALLEMQKSAVHEHEQDGGIEVIKEPIMEAPTLDDHSAHTVENKDEVLAKNTKEVLDLQLEVEILKIILKEERLTHGETKEQALYSSRDLKLTEEKFLLITKQCENLKDELQEAKSVIEALEMQNLVSINELEDLNNSNNQYAEILREKELEISSLNDKILSQVSQDPTSSSNHLEKLNKVQVSLEKAKILNTLYQNDRACHASNEEQMDEVRKQVEAETTEVIVCLQEELGNFQQIMHESSLKERDTQQELTILQEKLDVMTECNRTLKEDTQQQLDTYKEKLDIMTECNKTLREKWGEKDKKLYGLSEEIEDALSVGHMALDDVLNQFVPGKRESVSEKLQIIVRNISEKELRIEELNSCLEDAKSKGNEMESMLRSLRGAILVMSEAHQQDCNKKDQEIIHLSERKCSLLAALNQKEGEIDKLKESLTEKDFAIEDAEKQIQSLKVESCCYLDKFVEIDFMINKMVTENEAMKIEITELKKKGEGYSIFEEQLNTDTMKMKGEVEEIESMILEIKAIVDEDLVQMPSDFCDIKSCFHDFLTWHEEIWSEIIAKDWAVSVLHVCHLGILMETVTGMNAEKGLLYHGLCESNSLVSKLKEQNSKSRKELEACSMLRGKLLVDIKKGFDRISRKEEETGKLSIKVTSYQKKILELQVMEEMMLDRFNRMGHELSILIKELDDSHQNQQVVNDKDEEFRLLEEKLVIDSSAKEMELFIMFSKLEQMDSINNDLEKEKSSLLLVLEKLKEDMIISYVDTQLKDWILLEKDANIDLLKKEVEMQEDLKISLKHQLEIKVAELMLQKVENETLAVMSKDQKHEIEEFEAFFENLDRELSENVVKSHVFEAQLKEKVVLISTLEADLSRECESVKSLSSKIQLLLEKDEDALRTKERLEIKVLELGTVLNEKSSLLELLKKDLKTVSCEKDDIKGKLLGTMKEVENAQAMVEEKEEELKVYEKSVEELECTVSVLENQVEMVKRDAERQRLQREELELEIHNLKQQILSVNSSDSDMQRDLDEKEKEVQDLLRRNIILEKEITELNLQAREHNQTFKAMETPPAVISPFNLNSPLKKLDRSGSRSRGPASPFKCIRLGFVQQVNSEKDEELISARIRIEELETLVASRQKEIYMLNKKLSMAHDALGKKSDTTKSTSIDEFNEKTQIHNADSQDEKQEVIKLKQQLNDLVVERQREREEIERLQVALDQIHQQEQLLKTENEMFKTEIDNLKKDMMELEAAGQQNLQQQIHHHAKLKEENNVLKALNDKIIHKLKSAESVITLSKEQVPKLRQHIR